MNNFLSTLLLGLAVVAGPILVQADEKVLQDDGAKMKDDLEKHAWKQMRLARRLVRSGQVDEAEDRLRDAVASAPWLPDPHRRLAKHLLDHHAHKKQMHEVLYHFRSAMRVDSDVRDRFPRKTFPGRLKHDRDQLALLGERGKMPQSVVDLLVESYDEILAEIPDDEMTRLIKLPEDFWKKTVANVYDWALYVPEIEPLKGPALNPNLDFAGIEEQYLSSDPHFSYFDDLLTEEALLKLRTYYEEAQIFWESTGPGYVGSYVTGGGFGNPVVAQLIEELIDAFPRLICSHRLETAWAYKYDAEIADPIATHADEAAVNFNFWVSPNDGNLDKDSGGLVVYKAIPPEGTPIEVYNQWPLHKDVVRMLNETNFANFTIPYKSNRAVVFESSLFHESGKMQWATGYTKRRLNLTFLFGKMYGKCDENSNIYRGSPVMTEEEL